MTLDNDFKRIITYFNAFYVWKTTRIITYFIMGTTVGNLGSKRGLLFSGLPSRTTL